MSHLSLYNHLFSSLDFPRHSMILLYPKKIFSMGFFRLGNVSHYIKSNITIISNQIYTIILFQLQSRLNFNDLNMLLCCNIVLSRIKHAPVLFNASLLCVQQRYSSLKKSKVRRMTLQPLWRFLKRYWTAICLKQSMASYLDRGLDYKTSKISPNPIILCSVLFYFSDKIISWLFNLRLTSQDGYSPQFVHSSFAYFPCTHTHTPSLNMESSFQVQTNKFNPPLIQMMD